MLNEYTKFPVVVAIIGSREFKDYFYMAKNTTRVFGSISRRLAVQNAIPIFKIISGAAKGADKFGERFATEKGYEFKEYLPAFKKFGGPYRKADYYDRDVEVAEACNVLIGFLVKAVGENHGSRITIKEALDRYKEVHIFYK